MEGEKCEVQRNVLPLSTFNPMIAQVHSVYKGLGQGLRMSEAKNKIKTRRPTEPLGLGIFSSNSYLLLVCH